jgi:hypothetical protein
LNQKILQMKKNVLAMLFAVLIVALSTGCKKALQALFAGVEVPLSEVRITVPPNPIAPPIYTGAIKLDRITQRLNLDSLVKANTGNKFGIADVSSVKLKEMLVTIAAGANAGNNFQNFENVKVDFSSNSNNTPIQIASYDFPDVYADQTNIATANSPELVNYIKANELYYDLTVKPRRPTTQALTMVIKATAIVK